MMKKLFLAGCLCLCYLGSFAQTILTPETIDAVITEMTVEEKATILVGEGWGSVAAGNAAVSDNIPIPGAAGMTRRLSKYGIGRIIMTDGPAGINISPRRGDDPKTFYATGFPVGTALASTWNVPLVESITTAMGEEFRDYGSDVALAPGMDIHRNPLCGRNFEYFSEDPLLSGKMAAAYVRGIQSNGVGTCVKHFAANDQETNRAEADSRMNPRALREIALKGFEIAVKESSPWMVMSSYNKINGVYAQQSHDLLTKILRDEWGYDGVVVTDWGSKSGTVDALKAGNDLMEPGFDYERDRIVDAVRKGIISMEELDRSVRRVLSLIVKTRSSQKLPHSDNPNLEAHSALVRDSAAEGIVLLKNEHQTLPLSNAKVALFGICSYDMIAGGKGSGHVNRPYIRSLVEGFQNDGYELDTAVSEWYGKYLDFRKYDSAVRSASHTMNFGDDPIEEPDVPKELIKRSVVNSDIAVVTIGRNAGEAADRTLSKGDWFLTEVERSMIQDVADVYHSAGKKVVVVLNIGGVIETASWKDIPDAILLAWTPGQEVGATIADVMTGRSVPSGKLPMTFPIDYLDLPSSRNFPYYGNDSGEVDYADILMERNGGLKKNVDYVLYEEGIWIGYRWFSTVGKGVSYPFGFGLSYTDFEYEKPVVRANGNGFSATITVKNTGNNPGKEVVEIYVKAPEGGLEKPFVELKGFAKTRLLLPGESETITIMVDNYSLASFNESVSAWESASGQYSVFFASSVADFRAEGRYRLRNKNSFPVHKCLLPQEKINVITIH